MATMSTMTGVNADAPTAADAARRAIDDYAAPGRSALIRIRTHDAAWEYGVDPDRQHRAASLLKLGIAIAAEDEIRAGAIDPVADITVRELGARPDDHSVLDLLNPDTILHVSNVVSLMVGASDNACTRWLFTLVGIDKVEAAIASVGCAATTIQRATDGGVPITGMTTCRDALELLQVASDRDRCPITSHALKHSIRNSRIPLGATAADISIAHKTGSLFGLAHDVAILECVQGQADIAFLTDGQHDTLVAGYAMGICTREVLTAWGLTTTFTVSVDGE
jgi:beta-lactamase class A